MSNTDVKDTPENAAANTPPSGQGAPVDTVRASAQAGDPYRPGESNDYTLNVDPGDSGEATIANLYQAVPLEHEGFGDPLLDEGSGDSEGSGSGDGSGLGGGSGLGLPPVQPSGNLSVVPTSDAAPAGAPDGGGGGDAPAARGLDATLPQFALGGDGVDAGGQNVGPGIGSGSGDPEAFATPTDGTPDDFGNDGTPDDDGDDEDPDDGPDDDDPEIDNSPIGPVTDTDLAANEFDEDVGPGTVVGLTGFAEDPDAGDTVTYAIDDPRFVIDPDTGVVTVAPNAEFDAETEPSITVVVTATSSDGSSSSETFTFNVLDVNENPIGPVTDE
ncbi:cadherin repeat domain-containing protein, partial [Roseibium hamelinense]